MNAKRMLAGAALALVGAFVLGGYPSGAAGAGSANIVSLPNGATFGASPLPLAGTVEVVYQDAPPVANTNHLAVGELPPLAEDGDSSVVASTATPIPVSGTTAQSSGGVNTIVVDSAVLCSSVETGCTVGGDEPPVYSNASPNVASNGAQLFEVFESFAARSIDHGLTWMYADPATAFPAGDAAEFQDGFWGRQRLAQDPSRNLVIWSLQYGFGAGSTANGIRLAVARAADFARSPAVTWSYYDLTGASLGTRAGMTLETHQLQVSNEWLYLSVNVFDPTDSSAVNGGLVRLRLDALAAGGSLDTDDLQFYNPPSSPTPTFSLTPVNGAGSRMFFGSVASETTFRVLSWDDAFAAPNPMVTISGLDVTEDSGPNMWDCTGPSLTNPCAVSDTRVQTGWLTTAFGGEIGFLWNSDRRPDGGRPLPFVRALVLDAGDLSVKSQPDLYSAGTAETGVAWLYPSIAVNDRGHLAGTATVAPGSSAASLQAPAMYGFLRDDVTANANQATGWDTFSIATGTDGPEMNDWGAWSGAAKHAWFGNTWLLGGHVMLGGSGDESARPINAWVMRQRDVPIATSLAFSAPPPTVTVPGAAFEVGVEIRDTSGRAKVNDTSTVTLAADGTALACDGGLSRPAVAGRATFTCSFASMAAGATIEAAAGLLSRQSPPVTITHAGLDATCDGQVDGTDALAVIRALAGLTSGLRPLAPCTGDANSNAALDIGDALRIRQVAAGLR